MASEQFTMRMSKELKDKLEELSKDTGRSKAYLAIEAIEKYIDLESYYAKGIKEAILEADRGEGMPFDDFKKKMGIE